MKDNEFEKQIREMEDKTTEEDFDDYMHSIRDRTYNGIYNMLFGSITTQNHSYDKPGGPDDTGEDPDDEEVSDDLIGL